MKPWQTPFHKTPSTRGKGGTKREDQSLSQKSKTQSWSLRGKGTNHVPKPPTKLFASNESKLVPRNLDVGPSSKVGLSCLNFS
jgi:hypothetical protein